MKARTHGTNIVRTEGNRNRFEAGPVMFLEYADHERGQGVGMKIRRHISNPDAAMGCCRRTRRPGPRRTLIARPQLGADQLISRGKGNRLRIVLTDDSIAPSNSRPAPRLLFLETSPIPGLQPG